MITTNKTEQTPRHQVLDPCLLGRPVHLLHLFAAQLREDLSGALRLPMNRRYWGAFQIDAVGFSRVEPGVAFDQRWLGFAAPGGAGSIGFALERGVLLSVLNYRYGRSGANPVAAPDPATVRVTATEERLAVVLGQQLAATLVARVLANLAAAAKTAAAAAPAELKAQPGVHPAVGSWIVSVSVSELSAGVRGRFWFALDKAMMADILHGLLPERVQGKRALKSVRPLASRLEVRLDGRLVSKEMQLGALLDLRVGDVIPVSLSRTDVLLEDSRLFTAAVTEHKGKLCLTSFEDVE